MGNLPAKWSKTGSSSKPTLFLQSIMALKRYCSARFVKLLLYASFAVVAIAAYYLYLESLYLLDETYDFRGPKELVPAEKLTIRVHETANIQDLNRFVLHYSICPVVHEIQVVWHSSSKEPPQPEAFKYTTTHGKVSFQRIRPQTVFETFFAPTSSQTDGILLLDADVLIPCEDIRFAQTVWRSSYDGQIGFFPRRVIPDAKNSFKYLGPSSVLWHREYSLLLSAGIIVKNQYLQEMKNSNELKAALMDRPQCLDFAVSLWVAAKSGVAPMWVEADVDIAPDVQLAAFPKPTEGGGLVFTKKSDLSEEQRSSCISHLAKALDLKKLRMSSIKATQAKDHWTW